MREAHRAGKIDQGLSQRIESQVATAGAIDDLMLQFGISDMFEVKAALDCYSTLKSQPTASGSQGAAAVKEALQLLAALRTATGDLGLTAEWLEQQLKVAATCQELLGPEVTEEQLQELIDAAAGAEEAKAHAASIAQQAIMRSSALPSSRYSSRDTFARRDSDMSGAGMQRIDEQQQLQQQVSDVSSQGSTDQVTKKSRSLLSRAKDKVGRLTGQHPPKAPVPTAPVQPVPRAPSVAPQRMPSSAPSQRVPSSAPSQRLPRSNASLHSALSMALAAERGVANPDALNDTLAQNAQLKKEVASLKQQLESEKTARMKFAKQQEQLALEWKGQVKVLESYIRSMQAELAAHQTAK